MAATAVKFSGRRTLYFSSKLRSIVYCCATCIKVQRVSCQSDVNRKTRCFHISITLRVLVDRRAGGAGHDWGVGVRA